MKYVVNMSQRFNKVIMQMPRNAQITLRNLIKDIAETGPVQPKYHNYSKIGKITYHCHLAYKWVACWRCENGEYYVEVEYVGSREKAPY